LEKAGQYQQGFLIDKYRNITGKDPADDMNAGDLSAIIAEDKVGRHFFGNDFDGPSQRAPRIVPDTIPAVVDSNADPALSGSELYQSFGVGQSAIYV
jgi:hypothetical protein